MIEQLWYTWTTKGLAGDAGVQIRAASRGLMDINGKRYHSYRGYLNYYLPQGTDSYAATTENSPVCLAFLDFADPNAPAQGEGNQRTSDTSDKPEKNTHIVMQKVYRGKDAYGRPGVYFVHLIDLLNAEKKDFPPLVVNKASKGLIARFTNQASVDNDTGREPKEFVACDAIDMWGSSFWRISDDPPPALENTLEWVKQEDLRPGIFSDYTEAMAQERMPEDLPYLIQAFLSLQENQKLYIAAPWKKAAALIWGLTHSLPRSLQRTQKLTFSTYEKDVSQSVARVVGTCQAQATVLHQNASARSQQLLPATSFSGFGPVLGLDCYTGQRAPLEKDSPAARKLAEYARYATSLLMSGQKELLEDKLMQASENNIKDTEEFLVFIKANIPAIGQTAWTVSEINGLLKNLDMAAGNLGGENVQHAIIKLCIDNPQWRQSQALPALKQLRPFSSSEKGDKSDKREVMLRHAFSSLAKLAAVKLAEVFKQDDNRYKAIQELLLVCAPPDYDPEAWKYLLACLLQQLQQQDFAQAAVIWERRTWLLQQSAVVHNFTPIDDLIRPWLIMGWEELHRLLDAKTKMPDEWCQIAIRDGIAGGLLSAKNFQVGGAKFLLETHTTSFVGALKPMIQTPQTQALALQFCIQLLNSDTKNKYKHRLDLVTNVLSIKTTPPVDVEEFLKAAQLAPKERSVLIQNHSRALLLHPMTPTIEKTIKEFLKWIYHLIKNFDTKKLYSEPIRTTLDSLKRAPLSEEDLVLVDFMKCIIDTIVPKEGSLIVQEQYLRDLGDAIRYFELHTNETYMDGIYFLILKKQRSLDELRDIIENLAPHLFKLYQERVAASWQLLEDVTDHARKHYTFQYDWLAPYIQLAILYAELFEPGIRGKHLAPLLNKMIKLNHSSFLALDDKIKQDLSEFRLEKKRKTYRALWDQYGAGRQVNRTPAKLQLESVKEQTQEEENQSSNPQEQERENASASQDGEKDRQIVPEPVFRKLVEEPPVRSEPMRPQPPQPADDRTEKALDWEPKQISSPLNTPPGKKPLPDDGAFQGAPRVAGEQAQTDLSGAHALEVLSLVMDQQITRDELDKAYALQKLYVPFRIRQLKAENADLEKRRQEFKRQKKDLEARQVSNQQQGVLCEQELLEGLQNKNSLEKMLSILENDILIEHTLQQFTEARNIYENTINSLIYENMKKSSQYKAIIQGFKDADVYNLFCIFVRYRALERYFSDQDEPQQIEEWLKVQRKGVRRFVSAYQLDREV